MSVRPWPPVPDESRWVIDEMEERFEESAQSPAQMRARAEVLRTEAQWTDSEGVREAALALAERYERTAALRTNAA